MFDIKQFKALADSSAKSYHQQKAFIKKVLAGKVNSCPVCKQPLKVILEGKEQQSGIFCHKKCTDIALDID